MHRLTTLFLILALTASCGGGQTPDTAAKKTKTASSEGDAEEKATTEGTARDGGASASAGNNGAPKKDICAGFDISNLEDLLSKSDCEVPDAKPETLQNPDMKGKLEVVATASPTKVAPGGKVDLQVTFSNKTAEPMPLHFRIDPIGRFETEAYDAKKKRADMPAGQPPPAPKGHSAPPAADQKVAKVTIAPHGAARVRVTWDAVKMKWAPEKVRGTAIEKGYPRAPAGPLPKGKYSVKVATPLIGVFEGGEHEVSAPKVDVEVGP